VPTPEENSDLLPYFFKKVVLNDFRPCSLAAHRFAQNEGLPGGCGAYPGPAGARYGRKINGVSGRGKMRSFQEEKRGDPPPVHKEGGRNEVRGYSLPRHALFPTRSVTVSAKTKNNDIGSRSEG